MTDASPPIRVIPVPSEPFVELEHVNLAIQAWSPSLEAFFFHALGCADDPRAPAICAATGADARGGLRWANVGLQQFHLPVGEPGGGNQRVRGRIALQFPRSALPGLRRRLQSLGLAVHIVPWSDGGGEGEGEGEGDGGGNRDGAGTRRRRRKGR